MALALVSCISFWLFSHGLFCGQKIGKIDNRDKRAWGTQPLATASYRTEVCLKRRAEEKRCGGKLGKSTEKEKSDKIQGIP